jgi:ribosomal protein S18 acetylase RimI-like enzyme
VINDARLENPIWAALNSAQSHLSFTHGQAKAYAPDVAPFAAVPQHDFMLDRASLHLLPPEVLFVGALPRLPDGLTMTSLSNVAQMVYDGPLIAQPAPIDGLSVSVLDSEDPAMVSLTDLAFPGYFRRRTGVMGKYIGIHHNGQLIAMCGERMDLGDLRELSAICTHPDYRGRGYADLLIRHTMFAMQQEGVHPFLHVGAANGRAQSLYKGLGFVITRELAHTRLQRPID